MAHNVLFTGHMVDKADRKPPRFPAQKESGVQREIEKRLGSIRSKVSGPIKGIAACACGGDTIFHEMCLHLKIPSEICLAMSIPDFKKNSVSFAGAYWEKRYDQLVKKLPVHILPKSKDQNKDNIWAQANLWMLNEALKGGGRNMTLIALWDGKGGDGQGGTEHMVGIAKKEGATTEIIDIKTL